MINKLLLWITGFMPAKAIDLNDKHYIERYRVFKAGRLEVLLHRYLGSDGDRDVHDHPHRWSLGIPLTRGYTEERLIGFCNCDGWKSELIKIRPWRWNWVGCDRFHRIVYVMPGTWTLFIRWHRFKGWGFAKRRWGYSDPSKCEVVYVQPYDATGDDDWVLTAPLGKEFRVSRGTQ